MAKQKLIQTNIQKDRASLYLGRGHKRVMVKIDGMPAFALPEGSSAESAAFKEMGVKVR